MTEPSAAALVTEVIEEQFSNSRFTLSDLLLACWRKHPDRFGLKGYLDKYPDNNRLQVVLFGASGIIKKGVVSRVKPGVLQHGRVEGVGRR